jgi:DNA-binding CsgD family transcriptional regulator
MDRAPTTQDPLHAGVVAPDPGRADALAALLADNGFLVSTAASGPPEAAVVLLIDLSPGAGAGAALAETGVPAVYLREWPEGTYPSPAPGRAYLFRDADPEEILAAVHAVIAGLTVLDPRLLPARPATGPLLEALTPRELDVLREMGAGLPNKAIARRLGLSEHTVKYHVAGILSKLDAQSRAEAVIQAARRGLIPL